jgi:hypothetical protein
MAAMDTVKLVELEVAPAALWVDLGTSRAANPMVMAKATTAAFFQLLIGYLQEKRWWKGTAGKGFPAVYPVTVMVPVMNVWIEHS